MFITKMALPRRTFLRGMGVTVALPLLDAMVPALSAHGQDGREPGAPPRVHLHAERRDDERVDAEGRRAAARRAVADAECRSRRSRIRCVVPTGLSQTQAESLGRRQRRAFARSDGVAERRPPEAHRRRRRRKPATTVDQLAAQIDRQRHARCCRSRWRSSRTISSATATTATAASTGTRSRGARRPRRCRWKSTRAIVFERMFGDGGTPAQRLAPDARRSQHPRFGEGRRWPACRTRLGAGDRAKVGEYLDADARDRAAHPGGREAERRVGVGAAGPPDRRSRSRTTSTPS